MKGDNALARAKVNIVGGLLYDTFDAFLAEVNSTQLFLNKKKTLLFENF